MQEEIENRTVNLAISASKLTSKTILDGIRVYLQNRRKKKIEHGGVKGKQSVKQLIGQNQGVSHIDVGQTEIKGFERIAKKYGVDFAVTKDRSQVPPHYLIFFKARDADALTAVYKEYCQETLIQKKKPSVLAVLKHFKEIAINLNGKEREKRKDLVR